MKRILCAIALLMPFYSYADIALTELWETEGLRVPESVLYHENAEGAYLLVSEIHGAGNEANGKGGVTKMSLEGEIIDQYWVGGLNAPKGMHAYEGKLYVADLTEVVVIDIEERRLITRIEVPDSVFLNDITVDDEGVVYVTDTRTHKVHRLINHLPEVYLSGVDAANGILAVGTDVYVAAGTKLLKSDADKNLTIIAEGIEGNADGLEMIRPNEFIVTGWRGVVYHVTAEGELVTLLDTREEEKNTADIGWNPKDKVLYVPTFSAGSVVAYEL